MMRLAVALITALGLSFPIPAGADASPKGKKIAILVTSPTHPFIADDLLDLGLVYDGLKQTEKARRAFAAAIDVLQRGAGRDTPRVAYVELELARLDRQDGKDTEAEAAFKDARRILHKAEDEEHQRERRI